MIAIPIAMMKKHQTIDIFISYSHQDDDWREKLDVHLANLGRQGKIRSWHDHAIEAGVERDAEISSQLEKAKIILLLISPNYMASDHLYNQQLKRSIQRHHEGKARVIPVILRPTDLTGSDLNRLMSLPRNGHPISSWRDQDEALLSIVTEIRRISECGIEGEDHERYRHREHLPVKGRKSYDERKEVIHNPVFWMSASCLFLFFAFPAFTKDKKPDSFNPNSPFSLIDLASTNLQSQQAEFYYQKGIDQAKKGNYESAISSFTQSISIAPRYIQAYMDRGLAARNVKDHEGAISDFSKVIELDSKNYFAFNNRCAEKFLLAKNSSSEAQEKDFDSALTDCHQAIKLDESYPNSYFNVGNIKIEISRLKIENSLFADALKSYKEAKTYLNKSAKLYRDQNDLYSDELAKDKVDEINDYLADFDGILPIPTPIPLPAPVESQNPRDR
jgi:tetratricopeptide (TPR) repeat protein